MADNGALRQPVPRAFPGPAGPAGLRNGSDYKDLGVAYLDTISATAAKTNLVKRLERLGYKVNLEAVAALIQPLPTFVAAPPLSGVSDGARRTDTTWELVKCAAAPNRSARR